MEETFLRLNATWKFTIVYFQHSSDVAATQSNISRSNENVHLLCFQSIFYTEFNVVKIKEKTPT